MSSIFLTLARSGLDPAGRIACTYPRPQTVRSFRTFRPGYADIRRRRCARGVAQGALSIVDLIQAGLCLAGSSEQEQYRAETFSTSSSS
jgi:hypothetical protein